MIDNATHKAPAGYGRVSVDDDGRGILFGLHPDDGVPVVEIAFTRLHAGGKFDKGAGGAYSFEAGRVAGVSASPTHWRNACR